MGFLGETSNVSHDVLFAISWGLVVSWNRYHDCITYSKIAHNASIPDPFQDCTLCLVVWFNHFNPIPSVSTLCPYLDSAG